MKNKTDYSSFSVEELTTKAAELEANMEKMLLNHAITPLENPLTIRANRREIARVKTQLTKKKQTASK